MRYFPFKINRTNWANKNVCVRACVCACVCVLVCCPVPPHPEGVHGGGVGHHLPQCGLGPLEVLQQLLVAPPGPSLTLRQLLTPPLQTHRPAATTPPELPSKGLNHNAHMPAPLSTHSWHTIQNFEEIDPVCNRVSLQSQQRLWNWRVFVCVCEYLQEFVHVVVYLQVFVCTNRYLCVSVCT